MPRPSLSPIYAQFIFSNALSDSSNYAIKDLMSAFFDNEQQKIIGQPIPTESTVRRYRAQEIERLLKERKPGLPHNPLEDEWVLRRDDPDEVSPETKEWVIENIVKNETIRTIVPNSTTTTSGKPVLTRRNVMWIQALKEILKHETPVCIWSLSLMYSWYEIHAELYGPKFNQRYLDDYVSYRPWSDESNKTKYHEAIRQGLTVSLDDTGEILGHRIRLVSGMIHEFSGKNSEKKKEQ